MKYEIVKTEFPHMGVRACAAENTDGSLNIYVDTRYPEDVQRESVEEVLREWKEATA